MDKTNLNWEKLTPSAKEAFTEIISDLQKLILNKARTIAEAGQTGDKEISLRDIIEAKEELLITKISQERKLSKLRRLSMMFTLIGTMYSIIGVAFYFYQNKKLSFQTDSGLIMAICGILIVCMGFIFSQITQYKKEMQKFNEIKIDSESDNDFLKRWQLIEKLSSNLMRQRGFSNDESKSIINILKFISTESKQEKWSSELKELLIFRNKIVHQEFQPSKEEKQRLNKIADKMIEELEKLGK